MERYYKTCFVGIISAVLCLHIPLCIGEQQYINFNKVITCKLKQRLDNGLAHRTTGEHASLVRCAAACHDDCCGVSLDEHNVCYHHVGCMERFNCSPNELSLELYVKNPCKHNGLWDGVHFACRCIDGWVGDWCERYPRNCKEMTVYGYEDGFQKPTILQPETSLEPFLAYCSYYRVKKEFLTYVFYNTGEYDNTMTWADYVNGFHHDISNYWLGLDKLKLLNDAGHTDIFLRAVVKVDGTAKLPYYSYTQFRIGPAETGYNFTAVSSHFNSEGGVLKNCLSPVVGAAFSTEDHDNDLDTANCAMEAMAGWWFTTCDVGCNPLGPASCWRMTHFNLDRNMLITYMYFRDV